MKTLSITLLLAFSCLTALGQGQVQFRNYLSTTVPAIDAPVRVMIYGLPLANGTNPLWRAALIGGPTNATPTSLFNRGTLSMMYYPGNTTLTWVNFRSGTTPPNADGYVNVGNQVARAVPGVNWRETAMVQMVAWQGAFNTWDEAWYAFMSGTPGVLIGFSNPLTLQLPSGPTSTTLTYLWGLQPFVIGTLDPNPYYFRNLSGPSDQTVNPGDPVSLCTSVEAYPTPTYKWYFNGTLTGISASCYQIVAAQPVDAGTYYAVLTHISGTYTTRVATLTVRAPVTITSQPQSQTAVTGSGATFRVSASGVAPLSYQWFFNNSTPVGTGTSLKLTALETQNAGAYTVVVSNVWGAVTSAPAMLNVIPPVPMTLTPGVVGHAQSESYLNLEYADALAPTLNWQPLVEVAMGTNTSQVFVDWPPPASVRLYRGWQSSGVTQPPLLSMQLIPAIQLTGPMASSVRIDYINQVGPTDAWVTLATVQITATSPVYFDVSAVGQPSRLYRIVPVP